MPLPGISDYVGIVQRILNPDPYEWLLQAALFLHQLLSRASGKVYDRDCLQQHLLYSRKNKAMVNSAVGASSEPSWMRSRRMRSIRRSPVSMFLGSRLWRKLTALQGSSRGGGQWPQGGSGGGHGAGGLGWSGGHGFSGGGPGKSGQQGSSGGQGGGGGTGLGGSGGLGRGGRGERGGRDSGRRLR